MMNPTAYSINVRGRLLDLGTPRVMGILNVTPDSFYAGSRAETVDDVVARACRMAEEGTDLIDVGGCSTRPGGQLVSEEEELARLETALVAVRRVLPDMPLSVDTFRPQVMMRCVEEWGVDIINNVGDGRGDAAFWQLIAQERGSVLRRVPHVVMSRRSNLHDVMLDLAEKAQRMQAAGVRDIILDPGFGFGKTAEEGFRLLSELEKMQVMGLPVLVGLSRKSMIYKSLDATPDAVLPASLALQTMALTKGAAIIRTHDVAETVQIVKMWQLLRGAET